LRPPQSILSQSLQIMTMQLLIDGREGHAFFLTRADFHHVGFPPLACWRGGGHFRQRHPLEPFLFEFIEAQRFPPLSSTQFLSLAVSLFLLNRTVRSSPLTLSPPFLRDQFGRLPQGSLFRAILFADKPPPFLLHSFSEPPPFLRLRS